MSSNSNVEEERLAGVPRRTRKGGEISSNKESTWRVWQEVETNSNTDGKWRHWRKYQGVPRRPRKGGVTIKLAIKLTA